MRPLGLFFWGKPWTLAAWCELREDFRNFRLDRIGDSTLLEEVFVDEPGKTLRDMLTRYGPRPRASSTADYRLPTTDLRSVTF